LLASGADAASKSCGEFGKNETRLSQDESKNKNAKIFYATLTSGPILLTVREILTDAFSLFLFDSVLI